MKTIEAAELSGYLDGELSEQRMFEIQEAIAADPTLFAEFQQLQTQHLSLQAAAKQIAFKPEIIVSQPKRWFQVPWFLVPGIQRPWVQIAALLMMLVLRFAPKFSDMIFLGLALHLVVLAIILPWVVNLVREKRV